MDVRRSINTKIWSDEWVETLNPEQKLLWIYLLTNRDTNMLGIYEITLKRICYETGISIESIEKYLKGFESHRKAFYCFGRIILVNWMKNQKFIPNTTKCAIDLYSKLPKSVIDKLQSIGFSDFDSLTKGIESL